MKADAGAVYPVLGFEALVHPPPGLVPSIGSFIKIRDDFSHFNCMQDSAQPSFTTIAGKYSDNLRLADGTTFERSEVDLRRKLIKYYLSQKDHGTCTKASEILPNTLT